MTQGQGIATARWFAYQVCKERGHSSFPFRPTSTAGTWTVCRYCWTSYRFGEPPLIEKDPPSDPLGNLDEEAMSAHYGGAATGGMVPLE